MQKRKKPPITGYEAAMLAAEAVVSVDTVRRVYAGLGNANSRKRVTDASRSLGVSPPPEAARP